MDKLHFSITINAPKEKVWNTMLDDATYRQWTEVFNPTPNSQGSVEGDWSQGSKMKFIGTDENGKQGGMVSIIAENRPYEFLSIHHIGIINDGVEDTTSEEAKKWEGFENYTFKEEDGKTEVLIDMQGTLEEDFKKFFEEAWPKGLQKLKELSEK